MSRIFKIWKPKSCGFKEQSAEWPPFDVHGKRQKISFYGFNWAHRHYFDKNIFESTCKEIFTELHKHMLHYFKQRDDGIGCLIIKKS